MADEREKLSALGLRSVEDLYSAVPPQLRENAELKFDVGASSPVSGGRGLSEDELREQFASLALKNFPLPPNRCFLGGGHYLSARPALEARISQRDELRYPPSPARPERMKGTLEALREFQAQISALTGYACARAVGEGDTGLQAAISLAPQDGPIFVAASVAPQTRAVLRTFLGDRLVTLPWNADGGLDLALLVTRAKETPPRLAILASPNYFGVIERLAEARALLPPGCLLVAHCPDPSALALFEPPGVSGADLATGDARQFGMPLLFGGNSLGFIAGPRELLERTESIAGPESLSALRASLHLGLLGTSGFQRLGERNYSQFDYLARQMERMGIPLKFAGATHYREGVFEIPNLDSRFQKALERGIVPGLSLGPRFPEMRSELANCLLVCVNPGHRKADLDELVEVLSDD